MKNVKRVALLGSLNSTHLASLIHQLDDSEVKYKDTTVKGHYPSLDITSELSFDDCIKLMDKAGFYYLYTTFSDVDGSLQVWDSVHRYIFEERAKEGVTYYFDYESSVTGEVTRITKTVIAVALLYIEGYRGYPLKYGVAVEDEKGIKEIMTLKEWLRIDRKVLEEEGGLK